VHRRGIAAIVLGTLALAGCGQGAATNVAGGDTSRGKQLFQQSCGACHTLEAAGTSGKVGPDLDAAFGSDRSQGFAESTVRQVVADQIRYPGNYGADGPTMPPDLVKGDDVDAVAAYVASVAGQGGPETSTGAAAGAGAAGSTQQTTTQQSGTQQTGTQQTGTTQGGGGGGASVAAGKSAFTANGCSSCHTLKAAGATGTVGPDLDKLKSYAQTAGKPLDAFIHESIVDPNAYVQPGFQKGVMPPFSSLPASTIDALVKFLAASATS
jgi:cytochrome c2